MLTKEIEGTSAKEKAIQNQKNRNNNRCVGVQSCDIKSPFRKPFL